MSKILRQRKPAILLILISLLATFFPAISFAATNLALNKTTTTSSVWATGYGGAKAVDGNSTATSWASAESEATSWIYVNLGSLQTIDSVVVKWPQYTYASAFKIQTSTDASNWVDKYTTTSGAGGTTTANFTATSAQYVRVYLTGKADIYYEIFELEVYNNGGGSGGDTTAPTAPTGLTSPSQTSTSVNLSWTASTDNVAVTSYDVYKNGANPVNVSGTTAVISGLTASTSYTFTVKAKDAAGNASAASSPLSVTTAASGGGCSSNCHVSNATFLNSAWFASAQSAANIATYVNELAAKKIKYQFADIGVLVDSATSTNGTLPAAGYAGLATWIKNSRLTDPNQLIIIDLNYGSRFTRVGGTKVGNPNFGNATFNTNVNAIINTLVNVGVQVGGTGPFYKADGVHLDIEGFMTNDTTLLNTLQYLRNNALASNNNFSISTPADPPYSGVSSYQWSNAYIGQVAAIVNMMNPMIYDAMGWGSDITTANSFKTLWTNEITRYSNAIGNTGPGGVRSQLVPTLPSYELKSADGTVYHDPAVESLQKAAEGLNAAIAGGANVYGAGIFWWSNFIGRNAGVYGSSFYTPDQTNWMNLWVNHS
ncbi:discoidin domain-containing protein [Paenibacillus lignilyticus]|uniref:galactose-binding domain-containing protein n=1 Tax=Paenibacillus lignilyticus TaxID=1172615 RepID=UPI0023E7B41B|nr:discoidin domain-containing protein [Paenibacillus lignilyticus]